MTISTTWRSDSGKTGVDIHKGDVHWVSDTSTAYGGTGLEPNPHDLLDSALGACTTLTVEFYAKRREYPLTAIQVDVTRQEANGIYSLERVITLSGDLSSDQRADLLRIAEHCPIHKALHGSFQVTTTLQEG